MNALFYNKYGQSIIQQSSVWSGGQPGSSANKGNAPSEYAKCVAYGNAICSTVTPYKGDMNGFRHGVLNCYEKNLKNCNRM